jgi:hypothetical protein
VIKTERKVKPQILTAPIDGVVQQLVVHTSKGVVTPAQPLAVVVPYDSELGIAAMVSKACATCRRIFMSRRECPSRPTSRWARTPS